jgi:hypothetical protein
MTAVLEFENKESLDKLLKMAKIAGIYTKRKRESVILRNRQLSKEGNKKLMGERARKIIGNIRKRVEDAGETMTMEEVNVEIAEYRREKRMKCLA